MSHPIKIKVAIVGVILLVVLSKVGCFYFDKINDTNRRPWAFSSDASKPLLVGKWQGSVTDPDNRIHEVEMEIFVPTTDEERWKWVSRSHIKHDRSSPTFFDGMAMLEVNGHRDSCELWGGLDEPDGHQIHFQFRPVNDVHPPGFNLNLLEGTWQEHTLDLTVDFAFFKPDGSSFYTSEDPRYDQKGHLMMKRVL
ncbi:MAG: hypothetical protein K9J37_22170 [Saprospiraceae bacterium]|nr:hypothetical protein [Saprospiraceae bacterium]MCF8252629.1 hypothetical protein [Saprospiraceae bacterium]MCF8314200.1 hypothetical protein [Saprospiraceae bacterium]MCF8443000.1 hypothetical protein [Saprospiraceae bacterium]